MADHNWDFGLRSLQVKLQGLEIESVVYLRFLPFLSIKWSLIYELWQGFQLSTAHHAISDSCQKPSLYF